MSGFYIDTNADRDLYNTYKPSQSLASTVPQTPVVKHAYPSQSTTTRHLHRQKTRSKPLDTTRNKPKPKGRTGSKGKPQSVQSNVKLHHLGHSSDDEFIQDYIDNVDGDDDWTAYPVSGISSMSLGDEQPLVRQSRQTGQSVQQQSLQPKPHSPIVQQSSSLYQFESGILENLLHDVDTMNDTVRVGRHAKQSFMSSQACDSDSLCDDDSQTDTDSEYSESIHSNDSDISVDGYIDSVNDRTATVFDIDQESRYLQGTLSNSPLTWSNGSPRRMWRKSCDSQSETSSDEIDTIESMNTHANSQLMLDRHAEFRFQQILNGDFTQPSRSVSAEQASKISKSALKTQRKNDRCKAKQHVKSHHHDLTAQGRTFDAQLSNSRNPTQFNAVIKLFLHSINKMVHDFVVAKPQYGQLSLPPMMSDVRKFAVILVKRYQMRPKTMGKARSKYIEAYTTRTTCVPESWRTIPNEIMREKLFEIGEIADRFTGSVVKLHVARKPRMSPDSKMKRSHKTGHVVGESSQPIGNENVGHKMLLAMGWNPGQSLGTGNKGIVDPVKVVIRTERSGLGAE
ncbi:hypothetical protein BDEG_26723 [Batrachochytrium dendrobatidis JEL423]|uniref:G-patch domain-containing protein n=1 Tax=Batrachochytrium dendrobatidis (strain JEL423) TaxID=403673 RepID=A0A177WT87_BATDL|nr:hypothetical protein BDEG_26723 [Batrachochytrium dendrobatidis JEL423]